MRSFFTTEASVSRKLYINNKSSTVDTGEVYSWYLKPIQDSDSIDMETFWKNYTYTTDIGNDIREGDNLLINNEKYTVRWAAKYSWLEEIFYLKCILVKW